MGTGAIDSRITYPQAMTHWGPKPGHTIYLENATYTPGEVISTIQGSSGSPILIKPEGNFTPVIDIVNGDLVNSKGYLVFQNVHFKNSNTQRVSAQAGSAPTDIPITELHVFAPGVRLEGCWLDNSALGASLLASGMQLIDCVSWNYLWDGPDRLHQHAYYPQNAPGNAAMQFTNLMVMQGGGYGFHFYATSPSIAHYNVQHCILLNPQNIIESKDGTIDDLTVEDSVFMGNAGSMYLGTSGDNGGMLVVRDNVARGSFPVEPGVWTSVTDEGNERNASVDRQGFFAATTAPRIAHFYALNISEAASITYDLTSLGIGAATQCRLRNAQNPFNDTPTAANNIIDFEYLSGVGVDNGDNTITIPTGSRSVATPFGWTGSPYGHTIQSSTIDAKYCAWTLEEVL